MPRRDFLSTALKENSFPFTKCFFLLEPSLLCRRRLWLAVARLESGRAVAAMFAASWRALASRFASWRVVGDSNQAGGARRAVAARLVGRVLAGMGRTTAVTSSVSCRAVAARRWVVSVRAFVSALVAAFVAALVTAFVSRARDPDHLNKFLTSARLWWHRRFWLAIVVVVFRVVLAIVAVALTGTILRRRRRHWFLHCRIQCKYCVEYLL